MFFVFLDHNFLSGSQEEWWLQTMAVSSPGQAAGHYFWAFEGLAPCSNVSQQCFECVLSPLLAPAPLFVPCPWYQEPGTLPSLVPYRLTCTSLVFLFCCFYSVIVKDIPTWIQSGCGKTLKFSSHKQQSSPLLWLENSLVNHQRWSHSLRQFVQTYYCCVIRNLSL